MSQTTQCPNCGVVLTLPEGSEKRRLKCPRCGTRFGLGGHEPKPDSSPTGPRPASSLLLRARQDEPGVPTADRDLRETFAPDLLFGEDKPRSSPRVETGETHRPKTGDIANAEALFREDEPKPPSRRGPTAEARSRPRRCPACGSVVPAGMSLCGGCGLDLDTGVRTRLDEILEEAPPPPPPSGPPLVVSLLGGLTLLASGILTALALVSSFRPGSSSAGYLSLAVVGVFGAYASVQFLRMKSSKLLLIALMLGAAINTVALIGLPVYEANNTVRVQDAGPGEELEIENVAARLDVERLKLGIFILLTDTAAILVLMSPAVRKHFERHRAGIPMPV